MSGCSLSQARSHLSDKQVQMNKYKHWMGLCAERAAPLTMQEHSRAFRQVAHHKTLMRLHQCCWPLSAYGRPREERIRPLCVANKVDDKNHVLMQCTAYNQLCAGSEIDFAGGMQAVMQNTDPARLAALLDSI